MGLVELKCLEYSRLCTQLEYDRTLTNKSLPTSSSNEIDRLVALGTVENDSDTHHMAIRMQLMHL